MSEIEKDILTEVSSVHVDALTFLRLRNRDEKKVVDLETEREVLDDGNLVRVSEYYKKRITEVTKSLEENDSDSVRMIEKLLSVIFSLKENNNGLNKEIKDMQIEKEIISFLEQFTGEVMNKFVKFDYENLIDVVNKNTLQDSIEFFYSELFNIIFESIVEKLEKLLDPIEIKALSVKYLPNNKNVSGIVPLAKIRTQEGWREDPIVFDENESDSYYSSRIKVYKQNPECFRIGIVSSLELKLTKEGDKDENDEPISSAVKTRSEFKEVCEQGTDDDTAEFILSGLYQEGQSPEVLAILDIVFNKGGLKNNPLLGNEFLMKSFQEALNNSFLALEMLINVVVEIKRKLIEQKDITTDCLDAVKQVLSHRLGNALNILYGIIQLAILRVVDMGKEQNLQEQQDSAKRLGKDASRCVDVFHAIVQEISKIIETGEYQTQEMGIGDKKMLTGGGIQKASEQQNSGDGSKGVPVVNKELF